MDVTEENQQLLTQYEKEKQRRKETEEVISDNMRTKTPLFYKPAISALFWDFLSQLKTFHCVILV